MRQNAEFRICNFNNVRGPDTLVPPSRTLVSTAFGRARGLCLCCWDPRTPTPGVKVQRYRLVWHTGT